jgi:outer membrane protein OmpA-like peptidoglycan-associated protein/tetratricopeptide (TPR) repeat protein
MSQRMKKIISKLLFIVIFVSLNILAGFSQEQQALQNPKEKDTIPKINFKAIFDRAETYMSNENFEKALPLYDSLLSQNYKNGSWNFKLGLCYLRSATEYSKSVQYLENAIAASSLNTKDNSFKEDKAPVMSYLYLGDAYHRNYRFDDAIEAYKKFLSFISPKNMFYTTFVDHKIQTCVYAKELIAYPVNMVIKNLGAEINSPYPDYSPVLSADESVLLFTSRRPENVGGLTDEDGRYFEDIYISNRSDDEMGWKQAKNVGPPINTSEHEATIGTSIDGQVLFIYKDDDDSGSIYITNMQGDNWTVPEKIKGDVNSKYWETHATLSADGNTLYFVSNRPGGFGGRDIYRCKKLPSGNWSKAMNLGSAINTPYEEDSPFLQPGSNTLFFSSEGHKSMGGFDIFSCNFLDTGDTGGWSKPENLGYPINTTGDDLFFVPTIDKKRAYFSSAAQDSYGANDIYLLTFPEREESKLTVLRGDMIDDFGKVPKGAAILVTDAANGDIIGNYIPNPRTGRYIFILPHKKTYKFSYTADGYHEVTNTYKVDPGKEYMETEMIFILPDVRLEKKALGTVGVFGVITNLQKKTIKDVIINVIDNGNGKLVGTYVSDNAGKFQFVLNRGLNYNLSFESDGYLMQSANVNTPKENYYSALEKNVVLQPIAEGSKIVLNNLFFDSNKSKIRKESFVELEKVYKFLKDRPNINVEVDGYTDNRGDDKSNIKLSEARSKAVLEYLIKKGILASRIANKGYGKDQPIASNDSEEGRQMNRRVELKIIGK